MFFMSRRKKAIEKEKKQNSAEHKKKQAKKNYYRSYQAKEKWDEKKSRRDQSKLDKRIGEGVSVNCPLKAWETPSTERCFGCKLKCSYWRQ